MDIEQVRAELGVIAAQIDRQQPGRSTTLTIDRARSTPPDLRARAANTAAVVMAAFGLILLIACANVANLLLAARRRGRRRSACAAASAPAAARRPAARHRKPAAGRCWRCAGLLAAVWSFDALVGMATAVLPPWSPLGISADLGPDLQVLAYAIGLTIVTGIVFGLAPAPQASQPDLHAAMKQDGAGTTGGRRGGCARRWSARRCSAWCW